jgi:alanine dehydrogenase
MKFITEKDVENNLRMKELMDILEDAFIEYGEGRAGASPRDRLFTGSAFLNTMPAYIDKYGIAGLKSYVAGANGSKFVVMFYLTEDPENFFVLEANRLGQMRTGALPGMVSRRLLKDRKADSKFLLVGSGYQAETQLEAMKIALELKEAAVYSRSTSHAESFAEKMGKKPVLCRQKLLGKNANLMNCRHEVRIPFPARQDVRMQVILYTCTRTFSHVDSDVVSGRIILLFENFFASPQ